MNIIIYYKQLHEPNIKKIIKSAGILYKINPDQMVLVFV